MVFSGEASRRIDEGEMAEAIPIYRRALAAVDFPTPDVADAELTKALTEQRATLEGMLKELEKAVRKPATQGRAVQ